MIGGSSSGACMRPRISHRGSPAGEDNGNRASTVRGTALGPALLATHQADLVLRRKTSKALAQTFLSFHSSVSKSVRSAESADPSYPVLALRLRFHDRL